MVRATFTEMPEAALGLARTWLDQDSSTRCHAVATVELDRTGHTTIARANSLANYGDALRESACLNSVPGRSAGAKSAAKVTLYLPKPPRRSVFVFERHLEFGTVCLDLAILDLKIKFRN